MLRFNMRKVGHAAYRFFFHALSVAWPMTCTGSRGTGTQKTILKTQSQLHVPLLPPVEQTGAGACNPSQVLDQLDWSIGQNNRVSFIFSLYKQ
jgi:hypothetical protein